MWAKCYATGNKCDCGGEVCPRDEMYGADLFDDQSTDEFEVVAELAMMMDGPNDT